MYQNALVLEQRTEHFFYQIVSDNESNIAQYLKDWPLKMQKTSMFNKCEPSFPIINCNLHTEKWFEEYPVKSTKIFLECPLKFF